MTTKELNELKDKAYQNAKAHGFHDEEYSDEHYLMLIITELSEAVEAHRKGKRADVKSYEEYAEYWKDKDLSFQKYMKDTLEDELADAVIRLLDFAGLKEIDLKYFKPYPPEKKDGFTEDVFVVVCTIAANYICYKLDNLFRVCIEIIEQIAIKNGFDLWYFVKEKMKFNEGREKLHGKKY